MTITISTDIDVFPTAQRGKPAKFPFAALEVGEGFFVSTKPNQSVARRAGDLRAALRRQRHVVPSLADRKFEIGSNAESTAVAVKRVA